MFDLESGSEDNQPLAEHRSTVSDAGDPEEEAEAKEMQPEDEATESEEDEGTKRYWDLVKSKAGATSKVSSIGASISLFIDSDPTHYPCS